MGVLGRDVWAYPIVSLGSPERTWMRLEIQVKGFHICFSYPPSCWLMVHNFLFHNLGFVDFSATILVLAWPRLDGRALKYECRAMTLRRVNSSITKTHLSLGTTSAILDMRPYYHQPSHCLALLTAGEAMLQASGRVAIS
ncbi:hypothetical protein AOLI_G00306420 [Acnodon oligacanthus]